MDVVDAIAGVEMMADADDASTPYVNESTTPKEDVVIEKIEIVTYTGHAPAGGALRGPDGD